MTRLLGWHMYFDGTTNHSGYGIVFCWYPPRVIAFRDLFV